MDDMVKLIAKTVSCGGNILINVGPTKEGTIIPIFQVQGVIKQGDPIQELLLLYLQNTITCKLLFSVGETSGHWAVVGN